MDPNESSGLNSFFQQQPPQQQQQPVPPPPSSLNPGISPIAAAAAAAATTTTGATINASPTNGMLPNNPSSTASNSTAPPSMVYPQSVPSAVSTGGGLETVKRKRGRPRKYGTPEQAAAAKRLSSSTPMSSSRKNDQIFNSGGASSSSKRFQLSSLGNPGQSFTPHVITVAAGEDVSQKIMMFQQQSKREICILSASGSISNANLRQPSSGGLVSFEGRYEILSLSGSYVHNEFGGKAGGLSVCLANGEGQIVGGGVGGPLKAAGPIQVIVGTFQLDGKKDVMGATKGDGSAGKLPSPIAGASYPASGVSFRSPIDSSSYQNLGGQFMIQSRSSHFEPTQSLDWIRDQSGNDVQPSPENGNYDHIPDLRN